MTRIARIGKDDFEIAFISGTSASSAVILVAFAISYRVTRSQNPCRSIGALFSAAGCCFKLNPRRWDGTICRYQCDKVSGDTDNSMEQFRCEQLA